MKPRAFIGSSKQATRFAEAIHARLGDVAECTVWTYGAFDLAASTIAELKKNLHDSDFGIFVFAPDDVATIKGDLLNVPRDNVVYEAGLFAGYLGPDRCFIAIPQTTPVHVPTDLSGMTLGRYEENRTDGDDEGAVGTFCAKVAKLIKKKGFFDGSPREELRELNARFECCESWIQDDTKRIAMKREISAQIDQFCKAYTVNKHRLLAQHRVGYYLALFATIRIAPEPEDYKLILDLRKDRLTPGFAYYKLMDAVEALKAGGALTADELRLLQEWLKTLPKAEPKITERIKALVS